MNLKPPTTLTIDYTFTGHKLVVNSRWVSSLNNRAPSWVRYVNIFGLERRDFIEYNIGKLFTARPVVVGFVLYSTSRNALKSAMLYYRSEADLDNACVSKRITKNVLPWTDIYKTVPDLTWGVVEAPPVLLVPEVLGMEVPCLMM